MAPRPPKAAAEKAPAVSWETATLALVCGSDEYRVAEQARKIVTAWCPPDQQDLGLETVDGAVDTIDEAVGAIRRALDAVSTVGLFGGAKVVWLREASFFSEAVPGKYEQVKEGVARLTEEIKRGLMPGQRLLISASKVHRGYAFYKACTAAGAVLEFDLADKPKEMIEQAQATVRDLLEREKIKATGAVIQVLVDKAGYDTRLLVQEVGKLSTYLGDRRELTVEDVRLMIAPCRESASWDLAELISQRDLAGGLRMFRQLMFQKEKPFVLMMGLEGRIRDMLALRELMDAGYLRVINPTGFASVAWADHEDAREAAQALVAPLLKGHPFRLTMLARAASSFRAAELRRWYRVVVQTHARLTEGAVPDDLLFEAMMVNLIQGGARVAS